MSKTKKTKGQFDHYKKWTTDEGYTFITRLRKIKFGLLTHMERLNLGKLREVKE